MAHYICPGSNHFFVYACIGTNRYIRYLQSQTLKQGNNTVYFKNLAPVIYMVLLKKGQAEKTIKIMKVL
jgi:hypothetical protein